MEAESEARGLSSQAYSPLKPGTEYQPYVASQSSPVELTLKSLLAGVLFGILFGAANAYLGLRAGLTISTSIPVAVLTVAAFKLLRKAGRESSILEANISQTVGSASSSVASGVIFTLPALFLWELDPSLLQMTLLALSGGLLGVLFMIPLRSFLIEREHGHLPYPEGTACAEVLVASEEGGGRALNVFRGLGVGALFKGLTGAVHLIPDHLQFSVPFLRKSRLGLEMSSALFGVGFILGPRIGLIMVGGGLLSWLLLIPAIDYWGAGRTEPLYPETVLPIVSMSPELIWTRYVRYIGAGAVATGGLITLVRSIPTMVESFKIGTGQLRQRLSSRTGKIRRTALDLPLKAVGVGLLIVGGLMTIPSQTFSALPSFPSRLIATVLVIVFAFFFVTVSSRIVGLVGVTSNPTSGMTIATLLGTASIFLALGWTDDGGKAAALTVGCVVAIAASIAGDTSQDLKTGFILGATPRRQQIGELVGVLTSAAFVCAAVLLLDGAYGFGTQELPAPQATLMKLVIEGVLESSLPWGMILLGVAIALAVEALGLPSLPFAVGVYLPVSTTATVASGGLVRWLLTRKRETEEGAEQRRERGVLLGSGLVGGEGLMGVGIAAWAFLQGAPPEGLYGWAGSLSPLLALASFLLLIGYFVQRSRRD